MFFSLFFVPGFHSLCFHKFANVETFGVKDTEKTLENLDFSTVSSSFKAIFKSIVFLLACY